jgi:hypothetical protein
VHIVRHASDEVQVTASRQCPACGHDEIAATRQILAERSEAWRAGARVAKDALEAAELRGFHGGWHQGLAAGLEQRSAA